MGSIVCVLPGFFSCHMVADNTAPYGAQNGVMMHVMSRDRTDRGAFEATLGLGLRAEQEGQGHDNAGSGDDAFHGSLPALNTHTGYGG